MNNVEYCISRYFVGMKVEVGIPLPDTQTFRDWAIVNEIDQDLIALQLSRDMLPDGVSLRVGQALIVRSEREGQAHTCRSVIVSMGYDNDLLLRLTSEIFSGEMREFYRVDAFLPVTYQGVPGHALATAKRLWEARRMWRQDELRTRERRRLEARCERARLEERARELALTDGPHSMVSAECAQHQGQEEIQNDLYDELLESAETLAVTISGGGLRISTTSEFNLDELILLEIFVPSSRQIVDVVARVVFLEHADATGKERPCFNVGMQFVYIDESGRCAINSHLSNLQLRRIRHFKGFADVEPLYDNTISKAGTHYASIAGLDVSGQANDPGRLDGNLIFRQVGLGLFLACVISLAGHYFSGYAVHHPKNEIQTFFEKGISQRSNMTTPAAPGLSGG